MAQTDADEETGSSEGNSEYGKITQEAIDRMKARFGKVYPIELPFVRYVNGDSIAHAARAIGDANPLWIDPEHAKRSRFGKVVAPPALLYGAAWGSYLTLSRLVRTVFVERERRELERLQKQIPGEVKRWKKYLGSQRKELEKVLAGVRGVAGARSAKKSRRTAKSSKKKTSSRKTTARRAPAGGASSSQQD